MNKIKEIIAISVIVLIVLLGLGFFGYKYLTKQETFIAQIKGTKTAEESLGEPSGDLKIDFINVSEGESVFIKTAQGKQILIDGGIDNTVFNYLKDKKVRTIDIMITTHLKNNRILGLMSVLDNITVKEIWLNGKECERGCSSFFQKIKKKNIPVIYPEIRDQFIWGPGLKITVLNPDKDLGSYRENGLSISNSLAFLLTYGEIDIYLAGETIFNNEDNILRKFSFTPVEILKVSNITNNYQEKLKITSGLFLDVIKPEAAVIFVGENPAESPATNILKNLIKANVKIYRTDEKGTIGLTTNGGKYKIETEK